MGKVIKYMFGIAAAIIAVGAAIFLIFTYWEKILAYTAAGARVASNILSQFTGNSIEEKEEASDYYDI